jgi:hypothetical protein
VPPDDIDTFREAVDRLPNLQLLAGLANIEKQAVLPHEWLATAFPSDEQRTNYTMENDLGNVPDNITDFMRFYEARKALVRTRLIKALGVVDEGASAG